MKADIVNPARIYEGSKPYLFISYSHLDRKTIETVAALLDAHHIRYWYDDGLNHGDDWNKIIANHLVASSVCLLLLSPNSAQSEYVKNELAFAINHGVRVHILQLRSFQIPLDIEMLIGRRHYISMDDDYSHKLIKALPPEVFALADAQPGQKENCYEHSMYTVETLLDDRQGTKLHAGKHKRLDERCTVLEDILPYDEIPDIDVRLRLISKVKHPVFPRLLDYSVEANRLLVYQEYTGSLYLDRFLAETTLNQEEILLWIRQVVEGIAAMYQINLVFRDLARGSMIVTPDQKLKIIRGYHPYYGYVRFQDETRQYYFERELQEIAVLLGQLCTGKELPLPVRMIGESRFSKKFLLKVNQIIQKCTKEKGSIQYHSFEELLADLASPSVPIRDRVFLRKRAKLLARYEEARQQRSEQFIAEAVPSDITDANLEEQFGFDSTVHLQDPVSDDDPVISLLIIESGQVMHFAKKEIIVGRDTQCDMVWTQNSVSRKHLKIIWNEDDTYTLLDQNTTNGSFYTESAKADSDWRKVDPVHGVTVHKGAVFRLGISSIKIL